MEKGRLRFFVLMMLVLVLGSSASSGDKHQSWRKAAASTSPMLLNEAGPSIVFQLHGNVYPIGYYNVTINVGRPSKPYFLDVDTGSELTWLQCDAPCVHCIKAPHPFYRPTKNLVPCNDPLCAALNPSGHRCDSPEQCDYKVEYADGGSSIGVLLRDVFLFNLTNGKRISPLLSLGCGYYQDPGRSNHLLDGILGLGRGKASIISQLHSQGLVRNVIGHCISRRGGGFLFFGDDLYDSSDVSWASMSHHLPKHYSPGFADLTFGGKPTEIRKMLIAFDSGSSYTYFRSEAYHVLVSLVKRELSGKPLRQVEAMEDQTLPLCWKGRRPFKSISDVKKYFKPLALNFTYNREAKTQFHIPPEAFLIISSKGNVCLGILNGTQVELGRLNIIGDISMQDRMVIYNNEKQKIGWSPANCDRLPKPKRTII
uniref:Aspartic proteinase Asp1 n=1 Tax=Rhizophora mucronata TaxID=61149 RepID=A0A2P2Q411_RHIMU